MSTQLQFVVEPRLDATLIRQLMVRITAAWAANQTKHRSCSFAVHSANRQLPSLVWRDVARVPGSLVGGPQPPPTRESRTLARLSFSNDVLAAHIDTIYILAIYTCIL